MISLKDIIRYKHSNDEEETYKMQSRSSQESILAVKRAVIMLKGKDCDVICFQDITAQETLIKEKVERKKEKAKNIKFV